MYKKTDTRGATADGQQTTNITLKSKQIEDASNTNDSLGYLDIT